MPEEEMMRFVCKRCGAPLGADEGGAEYCSNCMIERAEQYVPEAPEPLPIQQERKSRTWMVLQLIILLACLAVIAIQSPRVISAFKGDRPLRLGTYATDAQTDQCIRNLWHLSKLLQEGGLPDREMVCPLSTRPYLVRQRGEDTVVSCPNPQLHGVREIHVSKDHPVPEIIR